MQYPGRSHTEERVWVKYGISLWMYLYTRSCLGWNNYEMAEDIGCTPSGISWLCKHYKISQWAYAQNQKRFLIKHISPNETFHYFQHGVR